ncbi:MAG: phospholipase [Polyangiaceae bacterium]|nr:phospholipase [Polyangiaceae bacterium]MCW5791175.1 phospholipase [Polyangiaceae bacterium]
MQVSRFGPLRARVTPPRPGVADRGLVVLLHGYGAPGGDLAPLGRQLPAPPGVRFAFPEAPLELMPGYDARAWWPIDVAALEAALSAGTHRDRGLEDPPELPQVAAALEAFLDALTAELGLTQAPLVLGGFSQGAMLSCELAARSARPLAGLMVLSGTLLAAERWAEGFKARAGLPVLQSHGRSDPLLSFADAERLKALFEAAATRHTWLPFHGQHELPRSLFEATGSFLGDLFESPDA